MNIFALIIGVLISIIVILRFKKTRLERSKFTYALLLFSFPFYYILFAIYSNDYQAISLEFVGGLLFFIIAMSAVKLEGFYKFNLLAIGYVFHGVYDVTHHIFFVNKGTPIWWPQFCGVIDIIIGLYLIALAFRFDSQQTTRSL